MEGASRHQNFAFRVMILYFLILEILIGRHATCSAESDDASGAAVAPSRRDRDGDPFQYGIHFDLSQAKQKEDLAKLHWVMVTAETLTHAAEFLRDVAPQVLLSSETHQRFSEHLYCQTGDVNDPNEINEHTGGNIVQQLIKTITDINTNGNAKELEVIDSIFACYIDIFNGISETTHDSTSDVNQDIQNDLDTVLVTLHNKIEELEQRRSHLAETYGIHRRERREANLDITTTDPTSSTSEDANLDQGNVDYSSLSLGELMHLLSSESQNLHLILMKLSEEIKEERVEEYAISFSNEVISFLDDVIQLLMQKQPNNVSLGHVQITHGPYCNGLTKTGTILELFWDMLEDAVNHTLAIEHVKDNETLTEAIENATCRLSAFGSIVLISSNKMNAIEFFEVSEALNITRLEAEGIRERLQERSGEAREKLENLTQLKDGARLRLAKIIEVLHQPKSLIGQLRQVDDERRRGVELLVNQHVEQQH